MNAGSPRVYADDTDVTFSATTIPDLESQINSDLKYIDCWLKANKLSLNVAKTEFTAISSRQKLQSLNDNTINIHKDGVPVTKAIKANLSRLSLMKISLRRPTFMKSLKKVSSGIGALKRVRPFVSMHTAIEINKGLIEPHFNYYSAVWDGLTQPQNRAIRVITKSSYDTCSRYLLSSLGWDNLSVRRAKQKANLMYQCINDLAPAYR